MADHEQIAATLTAALLKPLEGDLIGDPGAITEHAIARTAFIAGALYKAVLAELAKQPHEDD
jgi:hypothetical protein